MTYDKTARSRRYVAEECGERSVVAREYVHHGTPSNLGEWPWHVAVFHQSNRASPAYACGGTLVSNAYVVTAAHCTYPRNKVRPLKITELFVRAGIASLVKLEPSLQQIAIRDIIRHEEFNTGTLENDIALLKLVGEIAQTDYVKPVCFWTGGDAEELVVGKNGYIAGWGRDEKNELSDELKSAVMPIVSRKACQESDPNYYTRYFDVSSSISAVLVHPNHDSHVLTNNIAIVQLSQPVAVEPICLPKTIEKLSKLNFQTMFLGGTEPHYTGVFMEFEFEPVNLTLSNVHYCARDWARENTVVNIKGVHMCGHMSLDPERQPPCDNKEAGMPLFYRNSQDGATYLRGLLDIPKHDHCNLRGAPEVFLDVMHYAEWIAEVAAGDDHNRATVSDAACSNVECLTKLTLFIIRRDERFIYWYEEMYHLVYIPFHTNMGCYLGGIIMGLIYYKQRKNYHTGNRAWYLQLIWYLTVPIGFLCLMSNMIFYQYNFEKPSIWMAIFYPTMKHMWIFLGAIMIYGVIYEYSKVIKGFLNFSIFVPLGRLTYCAYVCHVFMLKNVFFGTREVGYFSKVSLLSKVITVLVFSYFMGLILALLLEFPATAIQKHLFAKKLESATIQPKVNPVIPSNDGNASSPTLYQGKASNMNGVDGKNESFQLLQLSDDSKSLSDLELPEIINQRKRKVRRKTRPRTTSIRHGDDDRSGSHIDCKNFGLWLAILMTILWLFIISYITSVVHNENRRLEIAIQKGEYNTSKKCGFACFTVFCG
ncbi:hypothetical protein quinque_004270 [Culex quinquefasciatus]